MGQVQFEIYHARDGYRWRLWSANGRIVAESGEAYVQLAGAREAVNWVQRNAPSALSN
jgi:uncharacterized protein YegP (UPF0339 family)